MPNSAPAFAGMCAEGATDTHLTALPMPSTRSAAAVVAKVSQGHVDARHAVHTAPWVLLSGDADGLRTPETGTLNLSQHGDRKGIDIGTQRAREVYDAMAAKASPTTDRTQARAHQPEAGGG